MILESGLWFTLEELVEHTGLSEKTIYNWSCYGYIPKARRGLLQGEPSKGLYRPEALDRIKKILRLKAEEGLTMKEIATRLDGEL